MAMSSSTRRRDAGFTFTEGLLVLLVVSAVTSAVAAAAGRLPPAGDATMFFEEQLKMDVQTVQAYAMANRVRARLVFSRDRKEYTAAGPGTEVVFRRKLPEGVAVADFGTLNSIEFNPHGSIVAFGKMHFSTPSGRRTMTVHIGKGRVSFEG